MRILATILCTLLANFAHAGCEDIAYLRTKWIYIDISDGGCATKETLISWSTKISNDGLPNPDSIRTVPFYKECQMFKDRSGFSCKANGQSPLAGATYNGVQHGKFKSNCDPDSPAAGEGPRYRFVCVKGCKNSVPKYLEILEGCD